MKKIIAAVLALVLTLSLAACGTAAGTEPTASPEVSQTQTPTPSETPSETAEPEKTPEPSGTPVTPLPPVATTEPVETEKPKPTPVPVTTEKPKPTPTEKPAADGLDGMALADILEKMLASSGFEGGKFFTSYPVTAADAPNLLGYEKFAGAFDEALGYGPQIGSIAFQMILFRLPEGADAQAFADDVRAGANPAKWICVQADKVETAVRGRTVLFVMGGESDAASLASAFSAVKA